MPLRPIHLTKSSPSSAWPRTETSMEYKWIMIRTSMPLTAFTQTLSRGSFTCTATCQSSYPGGPRTQIIVCLPGVPIGVSLLPPPEWETGKTLTHSKSPQIAGTTSPPATSYQRKFGITTTTLDNPCTSMAFASI